MGAGHGQGSAPLTGAGFGGQTVEPLSLGIIGLGCGGVEFMAAA